MLGFTAAMSDSPPSHPPPPYATYMIDDDQILHDVADVENQVSSVRFCTHYLHWKTATKLRNLTWVIIWWIISSIFFAILASS